MTKLNQIVAVEKGVKTRVHREIDSLYKLIQKTPLLSGISRTYRPKDDDGDQLPPESTLVQVKLEPVLEDVAKQWTELFDITFTKDVGNTEAKADVTVDGVAIAADVPVPTLLFLEKQLTDLQTVIRSLPTLDPAEEWAYDSNAGVYKTAPIGTTRPKKVPRAFVKAPATDKHPAQVEMFTEDVIVGTWETVRFSGAMPSDRRIVLSERIAALLAAVKFAREEANSIDVVKLKIGDAVFSYLLAG